ncbi:CRTAC1 family protein [Phycicoccus sp. CSK15P-2]|uniref:CRTAC1 family protein n=1 Tax=Phycicoccus sp. CSK15P-2 TaxID=2807627 RepID=UPI0019502D7E|nr:CRTAC1 family protein [Phycicoccus sp. CSK15P-2]MBM6405600.1 CRTAC1 family protein [Phycicoccus sp. CSK15P-2]
MQFRRHTPGLAAVLVLAVLYGAATVSAANPDPTPTADGYSFERMDIAMPPGYDALEKRTVRTVNPSYHHIRSWISSVGAGIAINDLAGHGRDSGMCLVDTRTDSVVVTYTPTAPAEDRFEPFVLAPKHLPTSDIMAPMGCAPGDFDEDGRTDILVYYWGRTPIVFQAKDDVRMPSTSAYEEVELVPSSAEGRDYSGEPWNTNAVLVRDLDGDSHPDIIVGNYFPQSGVLDPSGRKDVYMNDSLSRANNGGGMRVLRWVRNDADGRPQYVEDKDAVPYEDASGWALGLAGADLTGDLLPEVYVANDFGHDHLLRNTSTRGRIQFSTAVGSRGPTTPKSFVVGKGSFKGMGVDFVDLDGRAKFDMVVSNITTAWGLEESNFVWRNDARSGEDMTAHLARGHAPFTQTAQERGMAWTGWSWDVKAGDFRNSGSPDVIQTAGFVKGEHNRWAWLQELATANDVLVREPSMWPNQQPGDDLAGHQPLAFYAPDGSGRFTNITHEIGTDIETPSRGIAIGDTTGTGVLDFAVAYQWDEPVFYRNTSTVGRSLELSLRRDSLTGSSTVPAYGATVTVRDADGREQVTQLDGGSGHSGKRAFTVHVGLGDSDGPVTATVAWLDRSGRAHSEPVRLLPGRHTLLLTDQVKEYTK